MLPKFLCIGAQKAGTSWLHMQLKHHPDIWLPPFKEVHFFDHIYIPENQAWTPNSIKRGVHRALQRIVQNPPEKLECETLKYFTRILEPDMFSEDWYRHVFSRSPKRKTTGEITPEYSTLPDEGVRYVKELLSGDLKIIYIIRDPRDRAWSQARMAAKRRNLRLKGGEADDAKWKAIFQTNKFIEQRGDYKTYIPRWKKYFPEENFLFLPYGLIAADPNTFMRKIEDFVGISNHTYENSHEVVHGGKSYQRTDFVQSWMNDRFQEQYDFLRQTFPAEFVAQIK